MFLKTSQSSNPAFGNRLSRERKEVKIRREDGNDERPFYRSHFYWYSAVIVFRCFDHSSFVLSSYSNQHVNTSMTPYWSGFPVSVERFRVRLLANLWCR